MARIIIVRDDVELPSHVKGSTLDIRVKDAWIDFLAAETRHSIDLAGRIDVHAKVGQVRSAQVAKAEAEVTKRAGDEARRLARLDAQKRWARV